MTVSAERLLGVGAAVLLAAVLACAPARRPLRIDETRIDAVHRAVLKSDAAVRTLAGRARLIVESPQQSFSGTAVVHVKKPDSLFIRVEAAFGVTIGLIQADRRRFLFYMPTEKLVYLGDSSDTLRLKPMLGFDLTFEELLQTAVGRPSVGALDVPVLHAADGLLQLKGRRGGEYFQYAVDPRSAAVTRLTVYDADGRTVRLEEYRRFLNRGEASVPQLVRIRRPLQKESLTLIYESLEINRPLRPNDFAVKLPADVLKLRL